MQFRKWLFGGTDFISVPSNIGMTLLRIFTGLGLAFAHGLGKFPPPERFIEGIGNLGFPLPLLFAWLSACAEFLGGLLLAIGLLTRPAALFITINMCVAVFMRHANDPFSSKEMALLYLFIALVFLLTGSGKYGVDSLLGGKNKN